MLGIKAPPGYPPFCIFKYVRSRAASKKLSLSFPFQAGHRLAGLL